MHAVLYCKGRALKCPGDVKKYFFAMRALKRERCWPFCGLSRECRWLLALFSTGGQATVRLSWNSLFSADSQARVPPIALR
jgi:hypothetical protein